MTKPLPFTKASLKRAIGAAREMGLRVTGIRTDGTVLVDEVAVAPAGRVTQSELPPADAEQWGHVEA
jgi:hypothetical protein